MIKRLSMVGIAVALALLWAPPAMPVSVPFRVIYVEGGEYSDYTAVFKGLLRGLKAAGMIRAVPEFNEVPEIWDALSKETGPIVFLRDGFYSAAWDEAKREENHRNISRRLKEKKDVDLIISLGTWAGRDMIAPDVAGESSVPLMLLSCSDAYGAGLMATPLDSGRDNVMVMVDPGRWPRQISFFHKLFGFKSLGLVYEDTPDGRSQAGIDAIERTAEVHGFTVKTCTGQFDIPDTGLARERLMACHEQLAPEVEAMYMTANNALQPGNIRALAAPFTKRRVPTFAQLAPTAVEEGVLLSIAQEDLNGEGLYAAEVLGRIMAGEKPRDIPNVLANDISISLNMGTARAIGWRPPLSLVLAADYIHEAKVPDEASKP